MGCHSAAKDEGVTENENRIGAGPCWPLTCECCRGTDDPLGGLCASTGLGGGSSGGAVGSRRSTATLDTGKAPTGASTTIGGLVLAAADTFATFIA
jgi:hypothetical protein